MNILIFNCGSSSQIFKVYQVEKGNSPVEIGSGKASNVATSTQAEPQLKWAIGTLSGTERVQLSTHRKAAEEILKLLRMHSVQIDVIGHRFVHGGETFTQTTRLAAEDLARLKLCFPLAPLHNPNSYSVIEACNEKVPGVPQFAVFDTAFHAQMPQEATRYAIPRGLALKYGFRKYGFHGLSYTYVSVRAAELLGKPLSELRLIMCHLGTGGSSVAAFKDGHSIETSMGYSPLAGLVMSSRSGDIDAEIVLEMIRLGYDADEIDRTLNHESGLIGLSGYSSNFAEVLEEAERGNEDCRIAVNAYVNRLKLYIGGYYWQMNGADAIVFTDSIGVGSWQLREKVCGGVKELGIRLDSQKNRLARETEETIVSSGNSISKILVIPTDEEKVILNEVLQAVANDHEDDTYAKKH